MSIYTNFIVLLLTIYTHPSLSFTNESESDPYLALYTFHPIWARETCIGRDPETGSLAVLPCDPDKLLKFAIAHTRAKAIQTNGTTGSWLCLEDRENSILVQLGDCELEKKEQDWTLECIQNSNFCRVMAWSPNCLKPDGVKLTLTQCSRRDYWWIKRADN
ncbi:uncharacterized protein LOC118438608 [Folsomia candida]|uniref:uncharacterized protein LOC118438608 n=1 Tax=Folsomia candida TaxID=158441 RepID=UPI0016051D96|nr:uncharacterized protein LOC118438608 [Folsomia candida]